MFSTRGFSIYVGVYVSSNNWNPRSATFYTAQGVPAELGTRWRSQPRPPSQHKPVSAQLLWLGIWIMVRRVKFYVHVNTGKTSRLPNNRQLFYCDPSLNDSLHGDAIVIRNADASTLGCAPGQCAGVRPSSGLVWLSFDRPSSCAHRWIGRFHHHPKCGKPRSRSEKGIKHYSNVTWASYGVPNNRQHDCLFTSLLRLSTAPSLQTKSVHSITWTNADPVHRRIYAAPGGDELSHTSCYTADFVMAENRGAVTPSLPHWNLVPNDNKL